MVTGWPGTPYCTSAELLVSAGARTTHKPQHTVCARAKALHVCDCKTQQTTCQLAASC